MGCFSTSTLLHLLLSATVLLAGADIFDANKIAALQVSNAEIGSRWALARLLATTNSTTSQQIIALALAKSTVASRQIQIHMEKSIFSTTSEVLLIVACCVLGGLGVFSALIGVLLWFIAKAVGEFVKTGITTFDKLVIGTNVKFKDVSVDLCQGIINIIDLTVCNPIKDPPYETEYLFHAGEVRLDLDMWNFVTSRMNRADVNELIFKHAMVNYERPALCSSDSNVQDVLNFIESIKKPSISKLPRALTAQVENLQRASATARGLLLGRQEEKHEVVQAEAPQEAAKDEKDELQVSIRRMEIDDVGAAAKIRKVPLSLSLPAILSDDFREECDGSTVSDVVRALASKIGKAILANALRLKR